jgi:hypothetical protein
MLPLALACVLLAASGIVHGIRTDRWGPSADVQAAAARCKDLPKDLGEWEGQDTEMDARQLAVAEAIGYVSRVYTHRRTGQQISLLLICGRPGPISLHPPEVCYTAIGYEDAGGHAHCRVPAGRGDVAAELATVCFAKTSPVPEQIRVMWSWSDTGPWQVPENPRITFARSKALYKLYVVRRMGRPDEPIDEDPCLQFLRVLIPKLEQCLSPAS